MTETRPIRDRLYVEGPPPRLLGSRCRDTGEYFYPVQAMNPVTHRADTMETVELSGEGVLLNYSVVSRAAPGFDSPYAMCIVQLDDGPVLTTQLSDWKDVELRVGMRVALVIGPICRGADGITLTGPKFRPIEGDRDERRLRDRRGHDPVQAAPGNRGA